MGSNINRRSVLAGMGASATALALEGVGCVGRGATRPTGPNLLFIVIDDLNDWVGVLGGHPQAKTPNIDRLAAAGHLFTNAHCAAPACNPSRAAVLTGLRPTTTGVYTNHQPLRPTWPDVVTLPQHLREHGYETYGCGKIFHYSDPQSWDHGPDECGVCKPPHGEGVTPTDLPANGVEGIGPIDWAPVQGADDQMSDARVADTVIRWLGQKHKRPFFVGCGFFRPHLPWFVPQKYFDAYPLDQVVTPVVLPNDLDDIPRSGRRMARVRWHETIVKSDAWAAAVQGYLASLSFADAQLGRVLDALAATGRDKDTIVVLWTDHGWALGEKFHWTKYALWEECTRVPLIFSVPGRTTAGARCGRPVNLLDLYPTLAELCGLPARDGVEGVSLATLLDRPDAPWDRPSLMTMGRGNHALRDERWRYIRYEDGSEELYDHDTDPNEWMNLLDDPTLAADPGVQEARGRLAAWLPATEHDALPEGPRDCREDEGDDG